MVDAGTFIYYNAYELLRYSVTLAILKIFGFADFLRKSLHPHILAGPKLKILVVQARSDL